jgi:protein-S-isoprenylcysteine O-methyltransferase Ste14
MMPSGAVLLSLVGVGIVVAAVTHWAIQREKPVAHRSITGTYVALIALMVVGLLGFFMIVARPENELESPLAGGLVVAVAILMHAYVTCRTGERRLSVILDRQDTEEEKEDDEPHQDR